MNRFYFQAVILFLYCFFSGVFQGQNKKNRTAMRFFSSGGDGEIRTRGGKALTDFESAPL